MKKILSAAVATVLIFAPCANAAGSKIPEKYQEIYKQYEGYKSPYLAELERIMLLSEDERKQEFLDSLTITNCAGDLNDKEVRELLESEEYKKASSMNGYFESLIRADDQDRTEEQNQAIRSEYIIKWESYAGIPSSEMSKEDCALHSYYGIAQNAVGLWLNSSSDSKELRRKEEEERKKNLPPEGLWLVEKPFATTPMTGWRWEDGIRDLSKVGDINSYYYEILKQYVDPGISTWDRGTLHMAISTVLAELNRFKERKFGPDEYERLRGKLESVIETASYDVPQEKLESMRKRLRSTMIPEYRLLGKKTRDGIDSKIDAMDWKDRPNFNDGVMKKINSALAGSKGKKRQLLSELKIFMVDRARKDYENYWAQTNKESTGEIDLSNILSPQ